MFAIIIGLIVIALVVTLLLKGYYPQAILFMGGVVLLTCTAIWPLAVSPATWSTWEPQPPCSQFLKSL